MIVYKVKNTMNGKLYIGKTTLPLSERWYYHCWMAISRGSMLPLHCAIRKYGKDSFKVIKIVSAKSEEDLEKKEKFYIKVYQTFPPEIGKGYNLTSGGEGQSGVVWTDERKKQQSNAMKMIGHWVGKDHPWYRKERPSGKDHHMYGRTHSAEARKKISDAAQKRMADPNWVPPMLGKRQSEAFKKRASDRMRQKFDDGWVHPGLGRIKSTEERAQISLRMSGDNNPLRGPNMELYFKRRTRTRKLRRFLGQVTDDVASGFLVL